MAAQTLPLCVNSLQSSLTLLNTTISKLDGSVSDHRRLAKVLHTTRHFEILPESTLRSAQSSILATLTPQLQSLLSKIEGRIERLERREEALRARVELKAAREDDRQSQSRPKAAPKMHHNKNRSGMTDSELEDRIADIRNKKERTKLAVERLSMQAGQRQRQLRMSMGAGVASRDRDDDSDF